ncbi:hypothetical protein QS284_23350, partial [Escherichia coli]|nr:hypothetical protein [Escherichia coli]
FRQSCNSILRCPSISDGRLSYQFSSDGYIRRSVYAYAACGLLEGVLRYMSQYNLLDSKIHLASFDDHYLYDSLSVRIDTIQQDNRQLAFHCFELISQLIEGETPSPLQRYLPASLQKRYR